MAKARAPKRPLFRDAERPSKPPKKVSIDRFTGKRLVEELERRKKEASGVGEQLVKKDDHETPHVREKRIDSYHDDEGHGKDYDYRLSQNTLPPRPELPANPFAELPTISDWRAQPDRWASLSHNERQIPKIRANRGHRGIQTAKERHMQNQKWEVDGNDKVKKAQHQPQKKRRGDNGKLERDGRLKTTYENKGNFNSGWSGRDWDRGKDRADAEWRDVRDGRDRIKFVEKKDAGIRHL